MSQPNIEELAQNEIRVCLENGDFVVKISNEEMKKYVSSAFIDMRTFTPPGIYAEKILNNYINVGQTKPMEHEDCVSFAPVQQESAFINIFLDKK